MFLMECGKKMDTKSGELPAAQMTSSFTGPHLVTTGTLGMVAFQRVIALTHMPPTPLVGLNNVPLGQE